MKKLKEPKDIVSKMSLWQLVPEDPKTLTSKPCKPRTVPDTHSLCWQKFFCDNFNVHKDNKANKDIKAWHIDQSRSYNKKDALSDS